MNSSARWKQFPIIHTSSTIFTQSWTFKHSFILYAICRVVSCLIAFDSCSRAGLGRGRGRGRGRGPPNPNPPNICAGCWGARGAWWCSWGQSATWMHIVLDWSVLPGSSDCQLFGVQSLERVGYIEWIVLKDNLQSLVWNDHH